MRDLDFIARLGNKDAIRALRNLGNLAADTLLSLRPASPESCGEEPKPPHPFSLPVLTLQGDLSSITQILTREANAISSLPYSSIRNEFHARPNHSVPNIVIDIEESLIKAGDKVENVNDPISASEYQNMNPADRLERLAEGAEHLRKMPKKPEHERLSNLSQSTVRDIARLLIECKISKNRPSLALTFNSVAAESLEWPISTSAIQEKRAEINSLLDSLSLGSALPFKVQKNGPGRNRGFRDGQHSAFALEYCIRLVVEREQFSGVSNEGKEKMRKIASLLDNESLSKPLQYAWHNETIDGVNIGWGRHNHWKLKAALLPPFPKASDTESKADLGVWRDAAVLLARSMCADDWEGYRLWPTCVTERAKTRKYAKTIRKTQSSVKEMLMNGLKGLQFD